MRTSSLPIAIGLLLATGTAEHVGSHTHKVWLRQDEPHTVHRLHLNSDSFPDYVLLRGEDQYFHSFVLLAEGPTSTYTDSGLHLTYEQENSPYVAILDPDADGHPEILASAVFEPTADCEELGILRIPDSVLQAAIEEYQRLVGDFDDFNFKYGYMEQYPLFNLALDREVRFLRADADRFTDVSREFPAHMRWRKRMLQVVSDSTIADTSQVRIRPPAEVRQEEVDLKLSCGHGLRQLAEMLP